MDVRTIARNFSTSLNETFAIENNPKLEGLLQSVEQKYCSLLFVLPRSQVPLPLSLPENAMICILMSISHRKQAVTSQSQELEALEAKLRETEARLDQKTKLSKTGSLAEATSASRRKPVASTFSNQEDDRLLAGSGSPMAAQSSSAVDPGTSRGYSRWEGLMPQGTDQRSR